jgi:hypothetical protein
MRNNILLIVLVFLCIALNAVMDHYGLPYPDYPPTEADS